MKRTIKQILSLIIVTAIMFGSLPLSIFAQTESPATDFTYEIIEDSQVEITDYIGDAGEVVIPAEIEGYPVKSIGYSAFEYCESLTSVTIPESVISIGGWAFAYCTSLTSIEVSENNPNYSSENGVLFNKDKTELICCPAAKEGEYVIPASVTSIGDSAFATCYSLTNIIIPNGVTSIGVEAFSTCYSLTSITIPASVTSIDDCFISWCESLDNIIVSENNDYYSSENGVLFNKDKTEIICCPTTKEGEYKIPDSVTNIGDNAFYRCRQLTSILIPDGVTNIGESAFEGCSSMTSISIPNSVTNISSFAFRECYSLTIVLIPEKVTFLSEPMFDDCEALHSIVVSENNPYYSSENGVLFNKNKTELICCPMAKEGEYTIPNSVTSLGDYAFEQCYFLTSVRIPNSVTSISDSAFLECFSLKSITIPASVTSISECAFCFCDSITDVYYAGTENNWNAIQVGSENDSLLNATIHYNYMLGITPSTGSNVAVDIEKATVSGIAAESKPADVIAQFKGSENIQIVGKDGKVLADDALVGTGCKVQLIENGEVKDEVTVVIKGEIDGNGKIDSNDAIYLLRNTLFPQLYKVVVQDDVDGNGEYNSNDAIHLLRYTLFPSLYPLK